jgi:hypothetical protein
MDELRFEPQAFSSAAISDKELLQGFRYCEATSPIICILLVNVYSIKILI